MTAGSAAHGGHRHSHALNFIPLRKGISYHTLVFPFGAINYMTPFVEVSHGLQKCTGERVAWDKDVRVRFRVVINALINASAPVFHTLFLRKFYP